jgi:hypothetical protein
MTRDHLNFPPPPVPRTVRELLKDYPELIEDLQDGLTATHYGLGGPMDFERAVWLLKDMLGGDMVDAYEELDQAKARGDLDAAQRADKRRWPLARHDARRPAMATSRLISKPMKRTSSESRHRMDLGRGYP